jgi:PTS system cellobiose-specific IIB component
MKKIVLLCAAGMSTSLLVSKMKQYAEKIGYEAEISAHPVAEASQRGAKADIIMLGPQVRYEQKKIESMVKCPVVAIDMQDYGMMNGKNVVEMAKKILGE